MDLVVGIRGVWDAGKGLPRVPRCPTEDVAVAVNTVDVERFARIAEAARAWQPGQTDLSVRAERSILYVGSLVERKGVLELLRAFAAHGRRRACLRTPPGRAWPARGGARTE